MSESDRGDRDGDTPRGGAPDGPTSRPIVRLRDSIPAESTPPVRSIGTFERLPQGSHFQVPTPPAPRTSRTEDREASRVPLSPVVLSDSMPPESRPLHRVVPKMYDEVEERDPTGRKGGPSIDRIPSTTLVSPRTVAPPGVPLTSLVLAGVIGGAVATVVLLAVYVIFVR